MWEFAGAHDHVSTWELEPINKTDVTWIDMEQQEYKLHSVILSRQSVVFAVMYKNETQVSHKMDYPTEVLKLVISFIYDLGMQEIKIRENIIGLWEFFHRYECRLEEVIINFILLTKFDDTTSCRLFNFAQTINNNKIVYHMIDLFLSSLELLISYFQYEINQDKKTGYYKFRIDSQVKIQTIENTKVENVVFQKNNKHDVFWRDSENSEYCLHSVILQNSSPVFLKMYEEPKTFYNFVSFPTIPLTYFCELMYYPKFVESQFVSNSLLIELFEICIYFKCCYDIVWEQILFRLSDFEDKLLLHLAKIVLASQNMEYINQLCDEITYSQKRNILLQLFDLPVFDLPIPQVEEIEEIE
jgi:hypothetical protein